MQTTFIVVFFSLLSTLVCVCVCVAGAFVVVVAAKE